MTQHQDMAIKVANAPCSWGVLEFDETSEASQPYERVLDEMAAAGFQGTELGDWGFLPTTAAALADALGARALDLVGAFVPVALADPATHEVGLQAALRTARLLSEVAPRSLVVLSDDNGTQADRVAHAGRLRPEHGLSATAWQCFGRGADQIARAVLDETGLRTVFHHHCAGYVETPAEVARLLDATEPDLVGLCFDTGHYRFGGGDIAEALSQLGDRIWHVHFKDCHPEVVTRSRERGWDYFRSVREGVFCELGQGEVDFAELVTWLQARPPGPTEDGRWIVVEQDVLPGTGTPLDSARRNRAYLRTLGL